MVVIKSPNLKKLSFVPNVDILSIETITKGVSYAFTINPEEQYFGLVDRFEKTTDLIYKLVNSKFANYQLYIEVSPKGRIHAHGFVWIMDPASYYLFEIPYLISRSNIKIDVINDVDEWYTYCTKQLHILGKVVRTSNAQINNSGKPFAPQHVKEIKEQSMLPPKETNRYQWNFGPKKKTSSLPPDLGEPEDISHIDIL